jgi:predicted nucleic acid-binding Zn ribbon protein
MPSAPERTHKASEQIVHPKEKAERRLWQRLKEILHIPDRRQAAQKSRDAIHELEHIAQREEKVIEGIIDSATTEVKNLASKEGLDVDLPAFQAGVGKLKGELMGDLDNFIQHEEELLANVEDDDVAKVAVHLQPVLPIKPREEDSEYESYKLTIDTAESEPTAQSTTVESPFVLKKTVEQRPFRDLGVQQFFTRWCAVNDGIVPVYISREQWKDQQSKGILIPTKEKGSKQLIKKLYIPEDLQLWEMVGVMDAVDRDTYAQQPERQGDKKKELEKLGQTFKHAGTYLAQRLKSIVEGRSIAATLAQELYAYGDSLLTGQPAVELPSLENVAQEQLSSTELDEVDHWLAGDNLYRARRERAETEHVAATTNREEVVEKMRQRTLRQFFRTSEKAMQLQHSPTDGSSTEGSLSPLHEAFLKKINTNLELQVEKPRTELMSAAFRRGLEKLYNDINDSAGTKNWRTKLDTTFKKFGFDLKLGEQKLKETLKIDEMKKELADVRATGDTEKITEKEREFALRIQSEVRRLEYDAKLTNPADIAAFQKVNCVGFTTVGLALQRAIGLDVLIISQPNHSTSFLVTRDNRVFTDEMQGEPQLNEIRDQDITGTLPSGQKVLTRDLVNLSRRQGDISRITFEVAPAQARGQYWFVYEPSDEEPRPYIMHAYHPDVGMPLTILNNLQGTLVSGALEYEVLGDKNKDIMMDKLLRNKEAVPSNNNLYAATRELDRTVHMLSGGQWVKERKLRGSEKTTKFGSDEFIEDEFIKETNEEKRKDLRRLRDQLQKAHDLRHKGYTEEAAQEYRLFIEMADPKKDKEVITKVIKYITELTERK